MILRRFSKVVTAIDSNAVDGITPSTHRLDINSLRGRRVSGIAPFTLLCSLLTHPSSSPAGVATKIPSMETLLLLLIRLMCNYDVSAIDSLFFFSVSPSLQLYDCRYAELHNLSAWQSGKCQSTSRSILYV